MRYCFQCGRFTTGEPSYCNFCGRSYDVKLCPRMHVNSRISEVCSTCGSRDLSTPQPKVPFWTKAMTGAATVLIAALLLIFTVLLVGLFLEQFFTKTDLSGALFAIGTLLGILWLMWMQLPNWMREMIHKLLEKRRKGNDKGRHDN